MAGQRRIIELVRHLFTFFCYFNASIDVLERSGPNPVSVCTEFYDNYLESHSPNEIVAWFLSLYYQLPHYLKHQASISDHRYINKDGLDFPQFFFYVS